MSGTQQAPRIDVGHPVRMRDGPWKGMSGRVHALTTSVGGEDVLIVELDPANRTALSLPRSGLVVVRRDHVISVRRTGRRGRGAA